MTESEFSKGMSRLINTYRQDSYPAERVKLIFKEVSGLRVDLWNKIVDRMIGDNAFAPMLPQIREALAKEREQDVNQQKFAHKADAVKWANSEEVQRNLQEIWKRIGR